MRSSWVKIEKLAPILELERVLMACAPMVGLEEFFNPSLAVEAKRRARALTKLVARQHYRRPELELALDRICENLEMDLQSHSVRRIWFAVYNQICKRHELPRVAWADVLARDNPCESEEDALLGSVDDWGD